MDLALRLPPSVQSVREYSAKDIITGLGFDTNLELCLDAGDVISYPGTGQSWLDTSGNGYDFDFGADSGSSTDDPTFTGAAGGLTPGEYMSFDGGDYFQYDSANETWMDALHKDNATHTFVFWAQLASLAAPTFVYGTVTNNNAHIGQYLTVGTDGGLDLFTKNGTGSPSAFDGSSTLTVTAGVPTFIAVSVDEAGGAAGSIFAVNGNQETFDSAYSSPSSSAATGVLTLCARYDGAGGFFANGSKLWQAAGWSRALTAAELSVLYNATRRRFGV